LADQELILLTYDKKSGAMSYARVFVEAMTADNGREFVYLLSPEDHLGSGTKKMLFPAYTPHTDRFYNGTCFDAQLKRFRELAAKLKERPAGAK
jgi:hypothetical protein